MQSLEASLKKHPKSHLIFDFDETLFTLDLPWHQYRQEMRARLSVLGPAKVEAPDMAGFENQMVKAYGQKAAKARWEYSRQFEQEHLAGVTEHRELTDFIRQQGGRYDFYLWTSNMRGTVTPILKKADLIDHFELLVTKGDVLLTKPEAEGFGQIEQDSIARIGDPRPLSEYLMIGNSAHDQEAAENAGIDFLLVDHDQDHA